MTEPTRYPLAWPAGRPRRRNRVKGQFGEKGDNDRTRRVSLATACERVETQVQALGGVYPLLSTNLELRVDGRPRADRAPPADPGVCLYFQLKGDPYALACDTYTEIAQNVAAIAAHIEATRRIERYGVATAAETLRAFQALPSPEQVAPKRPWHEIFGMVPEAADEDSVGAIYRIKARQCAGDQAALTELNVARDEALQAIRDRKGLARA